MLFHRPTKVSKTFVMLGQRATAFPQRLDVRTTPAIAQSDLKACSALRTQRASAPQPQGSGRLEVAHSLTSLLHRLGASGKWRLSRSTHVGSLILLHKCVLFAAFEWQGAIQAANWFKKKVWSLTLLHNYCSTESYTVFPRKLSSLPQNYQEKGLGETSLSSSHVTCSPSRKY